MAFPAESGPGAERVQTLARLAPGAAARIVRVADHAAPATARRLLELGFAPGAEVTALRRSPWGDPSVYRVAGCDISLRRTEASLIAVVGGADGDGEGAS